MSKNADFEVLAWLEALSHQIGQLSEYRRQLEPQLAPEFSVLRYARTDEIGLSQILADMLNPRGPHGQGERFLKCFLVRFWKDASAINGAVSVRTEVATDRIVAKQRRIDIEVNFGDRVLAIENKPWAADQQAQISDYLAHLKIVGRPYKLLYLAGVDGQQPAEASVAIEDRMAHERAGTLHLMSYRDMRDWLRDCLGCCENERVSIFLRDFDRFIATRFSNDAEDFESRLILESALASTQGINAAVHLYSPVARELRQLLLRDLEGQLRDEFQRIAESEFKGWVLSIPKPLDTKHAQVEIARDPASALRLALAFEASNCGDCFFGIGRRNVQDDAGSPQLIEALNAALGIGQSTAWWGWWRPFEQRYWWNDRSVWTGIVDGTLSKRIMRQLLEVLRIAARSEFGPLFDYPTRGPTTPIRVSIDVQSSELTKRIHARMNPELTRHVFAVDATNWPLRRALAERVKSTLRSRLEALPGFGGWIDATENDLTKIYSGIGFRIQSHRALEVHLEFQSWGCRNAIYGLCSEGIDGRSDIAADLRRRLHAAGVGTGSHSRGWIWYQSLDPTNWFDQVETSIAAYEGQIARQAAAQIASFLGAIERAGIGVATGSTS
ncbi:MAG: PD-(D/E)XK nuclease family protein [Rhodanobacteraceae bacterium]|nr:PD-(D/E)XK nuclease family protein [Rhodanobacteraceae bacterium]